MDKIIAVVSGKGGTGKTSFVSNVGLVLNSLLPKVTLVDADLATSNLGLSFGMYQLPIGLQDALKGDIDIEDSIYMHPAGIRIIPSSISLAFLKKKLPVKKLKNLISQIGGTVIIDCPPGMGDDVISAMRAADDVIVVTNPQITSVTDSFKLISLARELGIGPSGIAVNRSRGKHEMQISEIESMCETPVIGVIPEDPMVDRGLFERLPVVHSRPLSPASISYTSIAYRLAGLEYRPPRLLSLKRLFGKR